MDALRAADGALVTTDEVVSQVIQAKGFDAADVAQRQERRDAEGRTWVLELQPGVGGRYQLGNHTFRFLMRHAARLRALTISENTRPRARAIP